MEGSCQLIKAFLLTLFWGGRPGARPVFLFTAPDDDPQGVIPERGLDSRTCNTLGIATVLQEGAKQRSCIPRELFLLGFEKPLYGLA